MICENTLQCILGLYCENITMIDSRFFGVCDCKSDKYWNEYYCSIKNNTF